MKIEFLPEAKAELDDAVEYYELQAIKKNTKQRIYNGFQI